MRLLTLILCLFGALLSSCNSEEARFGRLQNQWRKMERQHPQHLETMPLEQWQKESLFVDEALQSMESLAPGLKKTATLQNLKKWQSHLYDWQKLLKKQGEDPCTYDLRSHLQAILRQKELPTSERSDQVAEALKNSKTYFALAKKKLVSPDSAACLKAIEMQVKCVAFLQKQLPSALQSLSGNKKSASQQLINNCILEIQDYIAWCRWQAFEKG
jgi:hypothetical protein